MNSYTSISRVRWPIWLSLFTQFLLRWGWFVLVTMVFITILSNALPDTTVPDSYSASLQVQVQLVHGQANTAVTTAFFQHLLVSPDTLNLARSTFSRMKQFRGMQLVDLETVVSASTITNTNIVLLTATSDTPLDASTLVIGVYKALLDRMQMTRSPINDGLKIALNTELKEIQNNEVDTTNTLQSMQAESKDFTFQARLLSNLQAEQHHLLETIGGLLLTLEQGGTGNTLLASDKATPDITTVPGTGPTHDLRLVLSPLIGLLMGVGGALLASRFSDKHALWGEKRGTSLPHVITRIPISQDCQNKRLEILIRGAATCLPLLRHLRYQFNEHEKRLRFILVTSPKEQDGKSTIASSLAIASAQSGATTLLVDINPQKPVLHEWFKVHNSFGTLDTIRYLDLGTSGPSPTRTTAINDLGLLPIGNTTANEHITLGEPLQVHGLYQLTELLAEQAEVVIFDGPALLNSIDAVNLVSLADIVLLVVDTKNSSHSLVVEAESLLAEMGVAYTTILNRATSEPVE